MLRQYLYHCHHFSVVVFIVINFITMIMTIAMTITIVITTCSLGASLPYLTNWIEILVPAGHSKLVGIVFINLGNPLLLVVVGDRSEHSYN